MLMAMLMTEQGMVTIIPNRMNSMNGSLMMMRKMLVRDGFLLA